MARSPRSAIRKWPDERHWNFAKYGKLVWGDYALCFPVMQVREAAEQAQAAAERQAQQERQAREAAEQQVEQLLARLKQAGIEP
jgi:hypothetical protein